VPLREKGKGGRGMKERTADRIEKYMNELRVKEVHRAIEKINSKRRMLEEFAFFIDGRKGRRPWELGDLTEEDGRAYYRHLGEKDSSSGVERKIKTVNSFLEFSVKRGWIERRPWGGLYEKRKGGEGHFRVTEQERERMLKYLHTWYPKDFFGKRDRALLMVFLEYRLRNTEISGLDTGDYQGKSLEIRTDFRWRNRKIELTDTEREALESYLLMRSERNESPEEPALFIGYKRGRLAPGMVKKIVEEYLERTKEK
jgi:site-specific recombinase XerD